MIKNSTGVRAFGPAGRNRDVVDGLPDVPAGRRAVCAAPGTGEGYEAVRRRWEAGA